MRDQMVKTNVPSLPHEAKIRSIAILDDACQNQGNTCQGESDADFALLLLDIAKDVIRENADRFIVRPSWGPSLVDGPDRASAEPDFDEWLANDCLDDACAPAAQPVHNRPRASSDVVIAQEIEWKPEYGNRDAFYSTRQLAQLTRRSISRVRRWVQEGKIQAVRFGGEAPQGQMFIPKDQLERLNVLGIGEIL